jgi:hypothetical protein
MGRDADFMLTTTFDDESIQMTQEQEANGEDTGYPEEMRKPWFMIFAQTFGFLARMKFWRSEKGMQTLMTLLDLPKASAWISRLEFQNRGCPHLHWLIFGPAEGAPSLQKLDQLFTTHIPDAVS